MAPYTLPDLAYDYSALEPAMTGEILELHHSKHHAAYVKGANDTLEQLAEAGDSASPVQTVGLEKTLAFNLSGHVLHSIFWQNLAPDGGDRPDGGLAAAIDEHFGSFEAFSKRLSTATTAVQGSGWGVLGYEPLSGKLIIEQLYDHHGNVGLGATPLLVFDAWEHAYYLQYRNVRPDYVTRLWDLVNWTDVSRRFQAARTSSSPRAAAKLMNDPGPAFRAAAEAAQAGAGIIAARHRGDLASADNLLSGLDDRQKAAGFLFLADLAVALLAHYENRPVDNVAADLSLQIATQASSI